MNKLSRIASDLTDISRALRVRGFSRVANLLCEAAENIIVTAGDGFPTPEQVERQDTEESWKAMENPKLVKEFDKLSGKQREMFIKYVNEHKNAN